MYKHLWRLLIGIGILGALLLLSVILTNLSSPALTVALFIIFGYLIGAGFTE